MFLSAREAKESLDMAMFCTAEGSAVVFWNFEEKKRGFVGKSKKMREAKSTSVIREIGSFLEYRRAIVIEFTAIKERAVPDFPKIEKIPAIRPPNEYARNEKSFEESSIALPPQTPAIAPPDSL